MLFNISHIVIDVILKHSMLASTCWDLYQATCEAVFATDTVLRDNAPSEANVCLKKMTSRSNFKSEISLREQSGLSDCVVAVVGWHVPEAAEPVAGTNLAHAP